MKSYRPIENLKEITPGSILKHRNYGKVLMVLHARVEHPRIFTGWTDDSNNAYRFEFVDINSRITSAVIYPADTHFWKMMVNL